MLKKINPFLIEKITGKKAILCNKRKAELCGMGSILTHFTRKKFLDVGKNYFAPEINVWTSGFIKEAKNNETFRGRKINFLALRGHISKQRVENIIKKPLTIPLGDAGLLFNLLLDKKIEKKYSLGIIPHTEDFNNEIFNKINDEYPNSKIINLKSPPLEVLKEIASCEIIVSTAMHGLIAADSLGIPNKWLEVSNKVIGNGYKFKDYYSVFNIHSPKPLILKTQKDVNLINLNQISDEYAIKTKDVEDIRKELYKSLKNAF